MACAGFPESWAYVIACYDELIALGHRGLAPMCALVGQLRESYGDTLRAGTSVSSLVLSRSRAHGLRADQQSVAVLPRHDHFVIVAGPRRFALPHGADPEPLLELLDELAMLPID